MASRIEDYAIIGDSETVALVDRDGSIDWLCLPRFDSPACFAALLGDDDAGRWSLAPAGEVTAVRRRYVPGTLVLETEMDTAEGTVRIIDAMPPCHTREGDNHDIVRVVEGVRGRVPMRMHLVVRFDYGSIVPWVTHHDHGVRAVGGPDALTLVTPVATHGRDMTTEADFEVGAGDRVPFVLTWHPSHLPAPAPVDADRAIADTVDSWRKWSDRSTYGGRWQDSVQRSLITLKALTYGPTGGLVAAPTTSLPEHIGGVRNWDYRFCWLRDATFTLYALHHGGYNDDARRWRDWLLRTVAGDPAQLQIMYGVTGDRRLPEIELDWLGGYEGSRPVRVGNAAYQQVQFDVFGEVIDALHRARQLGMEAEQDVWDLQKVMLDFLEGHWQESDNGLWEIRGERKPFTHSRIMTWVAFDRAVKAVEGSGLDGPVDRWRRLRDEVHAEVTDRGFDAERGTFTQTYGSPHVDASLLLIPQVGFLPPTDERVVGTVDAVMEDLLVDDAFVLRYRTESDVDGLPDGEGAFLICSFWLVDSLSMIGRTDAAEKMFARLLELQNDVGLLAEEYDPHAGRMLGNFPQAFSHVGLVNAACTLSDGSPARARGQA